MSIFPLPLVPFEHYMLADDHVDYPMTFYMRLQFSGRFDHERAQRALQNALLWHPLLNARVQGCSHDRTARLTWETCEPDDPRVDWQSTAGQIELTGSQHIDLTCESGLRLRFGEFDQTTELLAQFHHACCDGLGAIQFLESFLESYRSQVPLQPPPEWEARHELRRDVSCGTAKCTWREYWHWLGQGLGRVGRYFKTRPGPLVVPRHSDDALRATTRHPAVVSHFFDEGASAEIRAAAKRRDVASNSLLMCELFLALDDWNRSRAVDGAGRDLRIVVPVNLRAGGRERLPAFNAVSLAFIDRKKAQLADARALLDGIDREVGEAKILRSKMVLLPALRFLGRFRNGICGRLTTCECLGSAVFSNLGIVFSGSPMLASDRLVHCDNLVLTKFEAAPPVRRNTLASFAASIYGNALTISLCYDAHCLTPDDGRALLDFYVRRLQASADGST